MPRRKKNGQSPARVPGGPSEGGSLGHGTGSRLPQGFDGSMVNNFIPSSSLSSSGKEDIVKSMQEMFSHLDPEVIYIVLSECDFKVENAMDSLLELSVAAEVAAPIPSPVSGFELTAAALLSPRHQPTPDTYSSQRSQLISSPPFLTEELDLLVDQELETLTLQQDISAEHQSSQYLSSFPQPSFPQQDLPELLQSSLRPGSRGSSVQQQGPVGGQVESIPGASSPLDRLSTWEDKIPEEPKSMVNFTHLMTESCADASKPPLDLAASGRPSAFQVYKKQDSSQPSTNIAGAAVSSNTVVGGARSKVNTFNQELFGYMPSSWNPEAPVFSPRFHENHRPTFITPVAQAPPSWPSLPRNPSPWMSQGPASQAPLKPSATIPKSWALHAASHPPAQHNRLRLEGKVLVLLRGAPGSGKSTLARALVENNPGGVTLSTDDFFTNHGRYRFDPSALGEAHEWNHKRATVAFERCINPIIIDNTNMQGWEMKPYVALKHGYKVLFREPDTWWKNKPRELERRSKHSVPWEKIRRMLDGYERFVSVQSIMGSQMPDCKKQRNLQENGDSQLEDAANQSADRDDEMDLGELDSELDARLELSRPGDQSIPDCIVESVMNEDHRAEEVPVAFSESIGQRVRRERTSRRSGFDNLEPADLLKDTNQSDGEAKETEKTEEEGAERGEATMGTQEMLNFVGDWPSEGSLQQRQVRRRERQKEGSEKDDEMCLEKLTSIKQEGSQGPMWQSFRSFLILFRRGNQTYAESRTEGDGGHVSEVSLSPVCEGSVETESNPLCGGSQERKQRQGRRSGKQCKLALTFTQNCPASSPDTLEGAGSTNNNSVNILNADVEPKLDLFTLSKCEVRLQPPSPSPPAVDTGRPTQTEPQDFARLWRLNRLDSPVDAGVTLRSDITVLFGESSRFVPELSSAVSAAVAVHPSGHKEVPYHVAHEKGTQVEEKEFGAIQDRLESLRILSRHFKLVSFDTLEDLYDKCHQDLDWTTNLLLDSGERFFKDEDGEKEMEEDEEEQDPSGLCAAVGEAVETRLCDSVLDELPTEDFPAAVEKGSEQITYSAVQKSDVSSSDDNVLGFGGAAVPVPNADHSHTASERFPETERDPPRALNTGEAASDVDLQGAAWGVSFDNGVIIEESRVEIEEEIASMDEAHRLLQAELAEMEREGKQKEKNERRSHHLNIQSVELKLSTEVALQLTELFGPVGVDPGSVHWGESQEVKPGPRDPTQQARFLISADGYTTADGQPESRNHIPFMDHWSVSRPHVSLREIIKEQQALQENVEKSRADLDRRDGATLMKENQLFSLFPTIDRHFLQDIFRNHNYSLTETELFLRSLLGEEPVKTVVAPEAPRSDHHRAQKPLDSAVLDYQDTEDPEYVDFRAEASLQRGRQLESFAKAAEAFKQGNKDVASFYAQQGHMHGKRMREANDRAAVQIFERVNSSLLPRNILDLHGLHVDEALEHLGQVLEDKSTECEQGLCQPQLSIITGRGNHSQGGVARIRPAVIDYLTNKHYRYTHRHTHTHTHTTEHSCMTCSLSPTFSPISPSVRFTEPNTGTVLVSLK
uniref:NEDD4 binding protein 2 n=1 Tax=Labrus bergylta TaxID=56723 RepID=A0A3Q3EEW4_9LABR